MALRKITDNDLEGKGVIGMADVPGLSAREMQQKVEEIVRDVVIPVLNENIDETATMEDLGNAIFNSGAGDMTTYIYDADNDGTVNAADNGIFTYSHSKSGTVHNLTGKGVNIRFFATDDWNAGDTLQINGAAVKCFNNLYERIENEEMFKKYAYVVCTSNSTGTECFFKSGGAGLNFKIVNGTAQPASPKENTIWVNTATKISSWDLSWEMPPKRSKTKNLLVYPYYHTTQTHLGVSYTDKKDGTVTATGTATGGSMFRFAYLGDTEIWLKAGTYTISGCPAVSGCHIFALDNNTSKVVGSNDAGVTGTFTLTADTTIRCNIQIDSGVTVSGAVFKPQLERGTAVTAFVKGDATGHTWLVAGADGEIALNAVEKNGIVVKVIAAYQWNGSSWNRKTVKGYIGGEWIDSDIYIFSSTHGINQGSWKGQNGTITVGDTLYIHANSSSYGDFVNNYGVDLTNISTVEFTVSGCKFDSDYKNNRVGVVSDSSNLTENSFAAYTQFTANGTYTVDTSTLNGVHYLKAQGHRGYSNDSYYYIDNILFRH